MTLEAPSYKTQLEEIMLQLAAGLSKETQDLDQFEEINFTLTKRQTLIKMETGSGTLEHELFTKRLMDKLEERADGRQEKVEDEIAPLNSKESRSKSKEQETSSDDAASVRDKVLNS